MGSTFSHMAANRFFRFFALQVPLGRTMPSKCTSVFAVKLQSNAVFRWLTEAWFFVLARLGCFFIKGYFRASFFAFFKFCYTSQAKRTVFNMRSGAVLAHFRKCAFHCRRIANNEALKLQIFTSRFQNYNFADLNCKKPTRR